MRFTNTHISAPLKPLARLAALCAVLAVAAAPAATLPAVTASALVEPDANSRTFGFDELARFGGGADLTDALRRLPGVQVSPEGRIQLRGMGNGYTRVEVNGVAVGGLEEGPVLDGFTVDMVERVEIVRGASASSSGEAVAGTLRITTRTANGHDRLRVSTQVGSDAGRPSARLGLEWSGRAGAVDYQLTGHAQQRRTAPATRADGAGISPDGTAYYTDHTDTTRRNQTGGLALTPQLVWRASPHDTLTLTSLVERSAMRLDADKALTLQAPWPADYATSTERERSQFWGLRPQLQWQHRADDGSRLSLDLGGHRQKDQGTYADQGLDASGQEVFADSQAWTQRQSGHHLGLRWTLPRSTALRWELGVRQDLQTQRQTDVEGGGESHSLVQRRQTAAFAQATAQLAPSWRLDAGLRHERTQLNVGDDSASRHTATGIWLPSATLAWDVAALRTLRLNAGRTYRAPRLSDLSPSTKTTGWNVPGNPDTTGNPLLRPERATGIELGLEQLLGDGGQQGEVGITLLQRRIQQRIQYQLDFVDDRWVRSPVNAGAGRVQGLELDGRWALADTALALPLTLRGSLGLYRSRLDGVDTPNGLPGQPRAVLNLGFEVHSPASASVAALTWGGNFHTAPGYSVRTSSRQTLDINALRALDLFAQWQFDPRTRLRLNASGLGSRYAQVSHLMTDTYGNEQRDALVQTRRWSAFIALEKDL